MFRFVLITIFLFSGIEGFSQYAGYQPVKNVADFRKQFSALSSQVMTISSTFTQEKVLTALTEKITSQGTFQFKRQSKVRIEYNKPFSYLMMMDGDRLYLKENGKETRVNVRSNKLFQQVNRVMVDCVQGTILESKDFSTSAFESESSWLLEMKPVSKNLKDFFEKIILIVDKKDSSVASIEMREPSGDYTRMMFRDKTLNGIIPDEVFHF